MCRFRFGHMTPEPEPNRTPASLPTPHPHRSSSLTNLGTRLCDRFQLTGSMADLEEGILMYCESLSPCPTPHPHRSTSLNGLGTGLMDCFIATGSMTDPWRIYFNSSWIIVPSSHTSSRPFLFTQQPCMFTSSLFWTDRFNDWPSWSYFAASWIVSASPVAWTEKRPKPDRTATDCNRTAGCGCLLFKMKRPPKDRSQWTVCNRLQPVLGTP